MRLDLLRHAHPDVVLCTWIGQGCAVVDLLKVPERRQRRGLGTQFYLAWEETLPEGMRVELYAVDPDAERFWASLGFTFCKDGRMGKTVHHHLDRAA